MVDPNKDQNSQQNSQVNQNSQQNSSANISISTDKFNKLVNGFNTMQKTVHNLGVKLNNQNNSSSADSNLQNQKANSSLVNNSASNSVSNDDSQVKQLTAKIDQLYNERNADKQNEQLQSYATDALKKNGLNVDNATLQHVMGKDSKAIDSNIKFLKSYSTNLAKKQNHIPKSTQRNQSKVGNIGAALAKQNSASKRSLDQYIQK